MNRRYSEWFRLLIPDQDFLEMEVSEDVIHGLWPDLTLGYVNPAWERFAAENHAAEDFHTRFRLGMPVLDAMSEPLNGFYSFLFQTAKESNEVVLHPYECSSPALFRRYEMEVSSLPSRKGLIVRHRLIFNRPIARSSKMLEAWTRLAEFGGPFEECAHCRKTKLPEGMSAEYSEDWEFIPQFLIDPPRKPKYLLCPSCTAHYVSELERLKPSRFID